MVPVMLDFKGLVLKVSSPRKTPDSMLHHKYHQPFYKNNYLIISFLVNT